MDEDEIFAALHEEWGEESDIEFDDSDNDPTYIEEQNVDEDKKKEDLFTQKKCKVCAEQGRKDDGHFGNERQNTLKTAGTGCRVMKKMTGISGRFAKDLNIHHHGMQSVKSNKM
ncbi:hypothetical protein LSTR_LSTR008112 [Laodelphax striatellus]|uniref:Uncharacterized protein n=1 Tax=Laodelphax striatellus TaxID=195883 RepID=A0A482XDT3_LAOST|nr:hypothetical protein LSTR_LSTR008112 [Laodelphax striatellus]